MIRPYAASLLLALAVPAFAAGGYSQVGASAGVEGLTGNASAWRQQEVDWRRVAADSTTWYAEAGHAERFGLNDAYLTGGLHLPVSKRWALNGELKYSPQYNVLPHYSLFAGVDYTLAKSWFLHAGLRHSAYQDSQANVATLGLETYVGAWRFAYTLFEGTSGGASGASNLVQADWYYGDISHVGLGLVHGREVERIDPTRLEVTAVNGAFLLGAHALSAHWVLTYTLGITSLENFYTRRAVSVGLAYRY